ncbi:MAG: pantoate--beta-alanine ligase [Aquificae bacterium]|nr:pantoate--beta-alanine ligase [Aquificota bacterium]
MPLLFKKVKELRNFLKSKRCEGKEVGFVPTMGYLHEGHAELIKLARMQNDVVVVSIFVNPTQFGEGEDYDRYPRDLERDLELCERLGVDVVFAPDEKEMYPAGYRTRVCVGELGKVLEGAFRPGHFDGVATVVVKLFNIVQPDRAYFGEKDYQQLKIIQQVVQDLNVPVEIVPVPVVREKDGLAYSSRNVYLKPEERESARAIYRSFLLAEKMIKAGERDAERIKQAMKAFIERHPHVKAVDYVEITDENLKPKKRVEKGDRILVAVRVGNARLIDNWKVEA